MNLNKLSKLLRFPNLLMVALVMYMMRYTVIAPILGRYGLDLQVSEPAFLILVLATLLITAAGYMINDYHDVKADRINHPEKVVVDFYFSRRKVMIWHFVINFIGGLAGIFMSFYYRVPWIAIIFFFTPFLLWTYSARLKHIGVLGNLTVSIFSALVPMLVVLFEYPLLNRFYPDFVSLVPGGFRIILFWISAFSFFAFLTTLIREIIKDVEDMEGDKEVGSKTLPLVKGVAVTKIVILILCIVTLIILTFFFIRYLNDLISLLYGILFLGLPIVWLAIKNLKATESNHFSHMSILIKVIMLFGLAYAPLAHFVLKLYL